MEDEIPHTQPLTLQESTRNKIEFDVVALQALTMKSSVLMQCIGVAFDQNSGRLAVVTRNQVSDDES